MASIDVKELTVPIQEGQTMAVEGATSILHVSVHTDTLIPKPTIEIIFDRAFLKAVLHGLDGNQFYGSPWFAPLGNSIKFSFDSPPFDASRVVQFTVYSEGPIHVQDSNVMSR